MATDHSAFNPQARLEAISDELASINSLILRESFRLRQQPDLLGQLITRCDELCGDLQRIKSLSANRADGDGHVSEVRGETSGLQA